MNVYTIHEGSIWEVCEVAFMFWSMEEAISTAYIKINLMQMEYDQVCNQGLSPEGKRWKENKDPRKFIIKAWDNGINEIYIRAYEVK